MSGIFRAPQIGFVKQAFKAIVLNPQRDFTFVPVRRCAGLLSVAPQSLQSRQPKIAPFTPLVQKAPIVDGISFVAVTFGVLYGVCNVAAHQTERRVIRDTIKKVEDNLDSFRMRASDKERIAYLDRLLKSFEPYFSDPYLLKNRNLKDYVKENSFITNEVELSRYVINHTITALGQTGHLISSLDEFDREFLDYMAIFLSLPRYPKCDDGFSLLAAVKIPKSLASL